MIIADNDHAALSISLIMAREHGLKHKVREHGLAMINSCVQACFSSFAKEVAFITLQNAHTKPAAPMEWSCDCGKRQ